MQARTETRHPSAAVCRALLASARAAVAQVAPWIAVQRARGVAVRRKGIGDFVTDADVEAERRLRRLLLRRHPDHGFLGEEGRDERVDAPFVWVVDPIDGTSNFARGSLLHAVSVACLHERRPVAAALFCWPEAECWSAARGLGAFRGRQRVRVSDPPLDDRTVIGAQWIRGAKRLGFVSRLLATGARLRVLGSTVLQFCEVLSGGLDGNVQEQGHIWDIAGCGLVLEEAGARVTRWDGRPAFPFATLARAAHHPTVVAGPRLHRELLRVLPARPAL